MRDKLPFLDPVSSSPIWSFPSNRSQSSNGLHCWNETRKYNDCCNKLVEEASAELDENKRKELYLEIQQIIRDDDGLATPTFSKYGDVLLNFKPWCRLRNMKFTCRAR
jgi:ABC-type transport system substrate-binding protein